MGIKTLTSWLENHPELKEIVRISPKHPEFSAHQEIVLDGWNLAFSIVRRYPKSILFQDGRELFRVVQQYVERFRRCGFNLVVFLDSWFNMDKMAEKIKRSRQRVNKHLKLWRELKKFHKRRDRRTQKWNGALINECCGWTFAFPQALRSAGCVVYFTKEEADIVMAKYVAQNSDVVYGIRSMDTDFFGFELPSHVVIIRKEFKVFVPKSSSQKLVLECYSPERIWKAMKITSFEERMELIARVGCDFVPSRGIKIAQAITYLSSKNRPSSARMEKTTSFYTLDDEDWMVEVSGTTTVESWAKQMSERQVVSVSSTMGAMDLPAAGLLTRRLRQHLYSSIGLKEVTEIVMVGDPREGALSDGIGDTVQVLAEPSAVFGRAVEEMVDESMDAIILCACHIFADLSPFDMDTTQQMAEVFHKQYAVMCGEPDKRMMNWVHRFLMKGAPYPCDMTTVNLFRQIVKTVHQLVGLSDVQDIWTWFNIPLFHFGLQQPRKFDRILGSCNIDGLSMFRRASDK